jgi:hypothetical protein
MNTEDKFYFGNIGTKEESELTVRITKMLAEVEQARLSRNEAKAKSLAAKVRDMIRKSANVSTAKMQMEELQSIMQGASFSRPGQPERFGIAERILRDGQVHLDFAAAREYLAKQTVDGLRYIMRDARAARDAMGTEGKKFNYYADLVHEASRELKQRGFCRPGQPERFAANDVDLWNYFASLDFNFVKQGENGVANYERMAKKALSMPDFTPPAHRANGPSLHQMAKQALDDIKKHKEAVYRYKNRAPWDRYARPGQPERFDMEGACWEGYEPVGTKQKDGKTVPNCVPMKNAAGGEEKFGKQVISTRGSKRAEISGPDANGQWRAYVIQKSPTGLPSEPYHEDLLGDMKFFDTEEKARRAASKMLASRPGQPDTFDASSLERGAFAEASKSPMLGKLLAAKAMPDGGWRAVQVGSDTLVISFEDADLARDFGRRVASKGYSATSPVATTGRYWNVEVKNG